MARLKIKIVCFTAMIIYSQLTIAQGDLRIIEFVETLQVTDGLILDLDADQNIVLEDRDKIRSWSNRVERSDITDFVKQDEGRKVAGSGRPALQLNVEAINGHNTVIFHRQELVNQSESAFDHLIRGNGYTWFSVMAVYEQVPGLPDVNSFFGNLKNDMNYEGFWGGLTNYNRFWSGGRNGITFGRWDENNPQTIVPEPLQTEKYYILAGRLGAGQGKVKSELFVNNWEAAAEDWFIVNPESDGSKMAIGQERDAVQHPGRESFDGEITRFLIFERPLSNEEMKSIIEGLIKKYNIEK